MLELNDTEALRLTLPKMFRRDSLCGVLSTHEGRWSMLMRSTRSSLKYWVTNKSIPKGALEVPTMQIIQDAVVHTKVLAVHSA